VVTPRTISTSSIKGTGFMKCIPMTRSGRGTVRAISVMEMELVLLASTASSPKTSCSFANTAILVGKLSITASTAIEHPRSASKSVAGCKRSRVESFSSAVTFPFSTSFAKLF
jgi:hypothetical protein